ncbi:adenosylcobinamide-GDP ribazoletransferase [Devosia sp. J2-20]|uniref:adenosylcobinamide-GDP ribazoletransferase n=1 Tax=Devosia sp. J2-20 TaxID=3026161 RepID=UPI00249CCA9D|nr:adenosylcobinamide-GDP ribazoletransferase [Devosia sp. J2-20]WDQ97852.1 adenosylcobinamide-GDP ribazoletransferase [Devosia sp. J2-20]
MTEHRPEDAIAPEAMEPSRAETRPGGLGLADDLVMALRFFSRLPTGNSPHQKPELNRIAMALPLASVVIGIGPALLLIGGGLIGLPAYFAAALAVAAMVMVSGAMAEDALADAADGLFGGHSVARRLEIMKDSRHGTYGVAALCLFLMLRVSGLGAIAAFNPLAAGAIWLAAGIVGRSGALWLAVALPAARSDGVSATAGTVRGRSFGVGAVFAVVLLFVLAAPATNLVALGFALVAALVVIAGWSALCRRLVGGQTGDLIGALGALVEIAVLCALLPFA